MTSKTIKGPRRAREDVRSVLVVELWNIGDVILTLPFLSQLRVVFPNARITLLARPFARELLGNTGLVDEFISANLNWSRSDGHLARMRGSLRLLGGVRALRGRNFDIAFSARPHFRERLLITLAGLPLSVGYCSSQARWAYTVAVEALGPTRHRAEWWLNLLEASGYPRRDSATPRLRVSPDKSAWAHAFFEKAGVVDGDLIVGVHPGASVPEKRWPLAGFREVAAKLTGISGVKVVAFSDPTGYGAELASIPNIISAQADLTSLMSLIEKCTVLICNDSGPMHIAGALGVPTVAIFAQGIADAFAPLGEGHEFVIAPVAISVGRSGIRSPYGVEVRDVLKAARRVLERRGVSLAADMRAPGSYLV